MGDAATPQVQQRTSRADGKANMIAATRRLLRDHHPDEITVRDVAEASGHHHRFVQAWFGGKVGLFREVFDQLIAEMAQRAPNTLSGTGFAEDTKLSARLMNWLVAADPESMAGGRPTPVIDQITELYVGFGLDRELARRMAVRLTSSALGLILFGDALGVQDDDISHFVDLERELVQLLAAARSDEA